MLRRGRSCIFGSEVEADMLQTRREDPSPDPPDVEGRAPPREMAKGMEGVSGRDARLVCRLPYATRIER